MTKKTLLPFLLFLTFFFNQTWAQTPQVPSVMEFGGISLKIERNAQRLIQANVEALTKSPKYFQVKVDRANIYFPLVEKILLEEGVPEDFKYLVLQESALIPDAVSTSNAVGYWQFKKEAASDFNLAINSEVDERMHIIASTRAAAKYFKKNNFYLNNWLNTLLSYNLGLGGVKLLVDPKDPGTESMEIKGTTHIYILKFLAHKIAFENALGHTEPLFSLMVYPDCQNKTLKEIAGELSVNEPDLVKYNAWLKAKRIPEVTKNMVIVPASKSNYEKIAAVIGNASQHGLTAANDVSKEVKAGKRSAQLITSNGLKAVIAGEGDNIVSLSKLGKIPRGRFIRYNEITYNDPIISGQTYYFQPKKSKTNEEFHTIEEKETFWSVSQKYGLKKSKLLKYNRIERNERAQVGRVLWLSKARPVNVPVEIKIPQTRAKSDQEVVKVITYPDKRTEEPQPEKSASNDEETFPDEFYQDSPSTSSESKILGVETTSGQKKHEVKQGETLFSISKVYGISVPVLKSSNKLEGNVNIKPGQILIIPQFEGMALYPGKTSSANYIVHRVASGESFYKIAKQYNVTVEQLQKWNNKKDYSISVGEELKILKN